MNKGAIGIGEFMLKAICLTLPLVFGVIFFAPGASAESGCGEKCRCHSRPTDIHPSKGDLMPLSKGFCAGNPMISCDLDSSRASDVPEFILSSAGGKRTTVVGPADLATGSPADRHNFGGYHFYQFLWEQSRSASIYLQNLSFLI